MMKRVLLCALAAVAVSRAQGSANRAAIRQEPPSVLWRDPRAATLEDWTCTFAGCDHVPASPFHFLKSDRKGTTPKVLIRDAKGRPFDVKFGSKVISECFASRFVAALGYTVEPSFYISGGKFEGMTDPGGARHFVGPDGSFARARFQLRDPKELEFVKDHAWSLVDNPFRGSLPFAGLRVVLMLLSNWDTKDLRDGQDESNTGVFREPGSRRPELLYSFFDWGSTLGRWGGLMHRTRSDCSGFSLETPDFITGVRDGVVEWGYSGKRTWDVKSGITVEDLRWVAPYLERITDEEIRAGLQASGATPRQTACWAGALENRMQQVKTVARTGRLWR